MDQSRLYILMCSKSREIQTCWTPKYGDFFVPESGRIQCWLKDTGKNLEIRKGLGIQRDNDLIRLSKYVWLPRLDQLIELAQIRGVRYEITVQDFHDWTKRPYDHSGTYPAGCFRSLEQIWLAFIMSRKYVKYWDDTDWLKKKQENHETS